MKCDRCSNEATVHEVVVHLGKRSERHLCEACAKTTGISPQAAPDTPLTALITQYIALQTGEPTASTPTTGGVPKPPTMDACPSCGMTFAQFRKDEKLGCGDCYAAFERQLGGLLERIHEGATHHTGKMPKRMLGLGEAGHAQQTASKSSVVVVTPAELQRRVTGLQKQLEQAVVLEQYEKAAQIRDELLKLQRITSTPPSARAGDHPPTSTGGELV